MTKPIVVRHSGNTPAPRKKVGCNRAGHQAGSCSQAAVVGYPRQVEFLQCVVRFKYMEMRARFSSLHSGGVKQRKPRKGGGLEQIYIPSQSDLPNWLVVYLSVYLFVNVCCCCLSLCRSLSLCWSLSVCLATTLRSHQPKSKHRSSQYARMCICVAEA